MVAPLSHQAAYPAPPGWWACYALRKPDQSVVLVGMPVAIWEQVAHADRTGEGEKPALEYRPYVVTRTGRVLDYLNIKSNMTFLAICPPEEDWRHVAAMVYSGGAPPIEDAPPEEIFVVSDLTRN